MQPYTCWLITKPTFSRIIWATCLHDAKAVFHELFGKKLEEPISNIAAELKI